MIALAYRGGVLVGLFLGFRWRGRAFGIGFRL